MSRRADQLSVIVEHHQHGKVDGVAIDVTTARMLLAVYAALSVENRTKFDSIPLTRLVEFGWKHTKIA